MKLQKSFYDKRLTEQNGKCFYCGKHISNGGYEIDHIAPHSKTKNGKRDNLCLACKHCNRSKRDLFVDDFRNLCKDHYSDKLVKGHFYFERAKITLSCLIG